MKRIFFYVALILLSFVLTGCAKYEVTFEVDKDKNVTTTAFAGANWKAVEQTALLRERPYIKPTMTKIFEMAKEKQQNAKNVEIKEIGDYIGAYRKYDGSEIDKVYIGFGVRLREEAFIMEKNFGYKKVYDIKLVAEPKEVRKTFKKAEKSYPPQVLNSPIVQKYKQKAGKPVYEVTIKIPFKATKTNATKQDDINFVYTWELDIDSDDDIKLNLTYEETDRKATIAMIIFAVIFVMVLLDGIAKRIRRD